MIRCNIGVRTAARIANAGEEDGKTDIVESPQREGLLREYVP